MLKRIVYTDFGQFVAALKSAERLGLRYRVERWEKRDRRPKTMVFGNPSPTETVEYTYVEYTLDILPDEEATTDERATA